MNADIDPDRFVVRSASPRGFTQAYVREGVGGVPLLCVHGWPETKRIFWKVIEPLAKLGFDVIVPDLRGFGDSDIGPDNFGDTVTQSNDLYALVHDHLGIDKVVLMGGDFGGPIIQDLAMRHPEWCDRMVLFNSPLPYLKDRMAGMNSRPPFGRESSDYYMRQALEPDVLAAELDAPDQRERYIATFYTSRFWAHGGAFLDTSSGPFQLGPTVAFHTDPFRDGAKLRASFRAYESAVDPSKAFAKPMMTRNEITETLILFGMSDHVIFADFDRMAAEVFANHVGPFRLHNCGHFVPWEAPHALVSATRIFCRDVLGK
jgi:pimeloyl-ACP methyl ester carboxylesterase